MHGLFILAVIIAALAGASYAGARFTAGRLIGPGPHGFGSPTTHFAFAGIRSLPGQPRGWVLTYRGAREYGPSGAEIYVSPTGRLLGTRPGNLAQRLEARPEDRP